MTSSDHGLSPATLQSITKRDPEALGELFKSCFPSVYALAYRMLGRRELAEDACQDVFLKVYRAAPTFDPSRDPLPWLMRITVNTCKDHWRSWAHQISKGATPVDADAHPHALSSLDDPEKQALRSEEDGRVQKALMQLTEENRTIVVLHAYQGAKHEDIGEMMGMSTAAVRKRYSRALADLARHLGEQDQ